MSGLFRFIFGGDGQPNPQAFQPQAPQINLPQPTPTPPPPDRSDSQIQADAEAQRKRYGIAGGRTPTNLTGGLGIPTGSTYSAAATLLGG